MAANWDYKDDESGIDHYEFAIFESRHGTKRKIYPDSKYNCCLEKVLYDLTTGIYPTDDLRTITWRKKSTV